MTMYHYLIKEFDKEFGKSIHAEITTKLYELKKEARYSSKNQQDTIEQYILPVIALYLTLCTYPQITTPITVTERYVWENKRRETKRLSYAGHLPHFFRVFGGIIVRKLSGDNWNVDWIENSDTNISFHITRCLWYDTLKYFHCSEICHIFCYNDVIFYNGLSDQIKFRREQTLGEGAAYCDFNFFSP